METILEVNNVVKTFHEFGGRSFRAVDGISIVVEAGECVGIVGESGCGKSTLAKIITHLILPDSGNVKLCGTDMTSAKRKTIRAAYRDMKMIFQEPRSSFDPRMTLGDSLSDALKAIMPDKKQRSMEMKRLFEKVGLDEKYLNLYPTQVSGGECQRAAIARAVAQKPRLLICDEATSALDVSVQAQIVELLNDIRKETGLALLFISHDLALVSCFCDRIYVLREGKIVENGVTDQIINEPKQEYTKRLLNSVLSI